MKTKVKNTLLGGSDHGQPDHQRTEAKRARIGNNDGSEMPKGSATTSNIDEGFLCRYGEIVNFGLRPISCLTTMATSLLGSATAKDPIAASLALWRLVYPVSEVAFNFHLRHQCVHYYFT